MDLRRGWTVGFLARSQQRPTLIRTALVIRRRRRSDEYATCPCGDRAAPPQAPRPQAGHEPGIAAREGAIRVSTLGQIEPPPPQRVVKLLRAGLRSDYLGDSSDRQGNRNIEEEYL